jgi:hypothetical protein
MQSPKNSQKQKQLTPSSCNPQVLNPVVSSAPNIEREILLKKIESLQYTVREQKTINTDIQAKLSQASGYIEWQRKELKFNDDLIDAMHRTIKTYYHSYNSLLAIHNDNLEKCKELQHINGFLLNGESWKPEIQKMVEANKLPINLN